MKGSLRERTAGVFELRIFLGVDPITGKRLYRSVTFRGNRRDAESELARHVTDALARRLTGGRPAPGKVTLNQLLDEFFAGFKGSPTTLRAYQSQHRSYIDEAIGRLPLEKITPRLLGQFYEYIGEEHQVAPATVRRVHALLSSAFRLAIRWEWMVRNPAADAEVPRMPKREPTVPTRQQVLAVLQAADEYEDDFGVFVRLAAATGARRGELCALRWAQVELDPGVVRIEANLVPVEGGTLRKDTKNHSKRSVPIDQTTVAALGAHWERMEARAFDCVVEMSPEAHVFSYAADSSAPWHPDTVSSKWAKVREAAGLGAEIRLHDLRHFQATMLLAAGLPVTNVAKRIGHRDSATTLNVYAHAVEELDWAAVGPMEGFLAPVPEPRPN